MLSIKDTEKRRHILVKNGVKCACSHTMPIPNSKDRTICSWCGRFVYRTPELEEKYKKEEFKRKIGKMIK